MSEKQTMTDVLTRHGEWRYTNGAGSPIVCRECGDVIETNVTAHQAAALTAAGFGPVAETRDTIQRLNRRAQVAESALNAVTSEGRAGIREDKLIREYWQRAEDARAELRKLRAEVAYQKARAAYFKYVPEIENDPEGVKTLVIEMRAARDRYLNIPPFSSP